MDYLLVYIIITIVIIIAVCAIIYYFYNKNLKAKEKLYNNPQIQEIDDFLTPEECDTLIRMSEYKLETSQVYSSKDNLHDTSHRVSEQAWLKSIDSEIVKRISDRVAKHSGYPIDNQEDLQVVKYKPGGFFNPHNDACDGDADFCKRMNSKSGPRYATYLIYLNDDFTGGETVFTKMNVTVKPKKGKCVKFYSTNKNESLIKNSEHAGHPVTSGNKWICNVWIRHKRFIG